MLPPGMGETSDDLTARLLLLIAEFGETVSQAMKDATGEPDRSRGGSWSSRSR